MNDKLSELRNDFNQLVEKVDLTSYNPMSTDFQKILNVGLMWMLLDELAEEHEEQLEDDYDYLKDELMGSEKYYKLYMENKDPSLKSMASNELSHANYWLNKVRLASKSSKEQSTYNSMLSWYNNLLERINK